MHHSKMLPMIKRWPWMARYCWFAECTIAWVSPVLGFLYCQWGLPTNAVFWMLVAIWAGRGAMVRYAVHLYLEQIDAQYLQYQRIMQEYRSTIEYLEAWRKRN